MRPRGSPAERTGVVVMRVWIEPAADPASGLRIRITETPDIERGESVTVAVAKVADAIDVVRRFLESFAGDVDDVVTSA
jgi:hypothetical protein